MSYTRIDGRQPNELRQLSCSLGGSNCASVFQRSVALGQYFMC